MPAESPNAITLASYEAAAPLWRDRSSSAIGPAKLRFLEMLLAQLPPGANVLEVGSGTGRDAEWMEQHGLRVRRTDGALAFVELMRADGLEAEILNVVTDEIAGRYDLIYASAVFLHLRVDELQQVLAKTAAAVLGRGLLAFTVKQGDGAKWTHDKIDRPRFFTYWQPEDLQEQLESSPWETLLLEEVAGLREQWLFVLCRVRKPA